MSINTINELFFTVVARDTGRAILFKEAVLWESASSRDIYRNVVGVARALQSWGISRGDRVAILSENRPEWAYADFASMLIGACSVPVYPTLTAEQVAYTLKDSGARILFVSTLNHLEKVQSIKSETHIERIVLMESHGPVATAPATISMKGLMAQGPTERDPGFDRCALSISPDATATLIYTSGTTGTPKGAILTHGNLAANIRHSTDSMDLRSGQVSISYLPLSHITARHLDYAMFWRGVTIAYCPYIEELLQTLQEVRPNVFVGVPRVFEKISANVRSKVGAGLKRKVFDWAMKIGARHRQEVFAGQRVQDPLWNLADILLFSKVRHALGGKVDLFISGGAPLGEATLNWYASIGIRIFEGYGLTETSPVIGLNNPRFYRPGSIGRPLANVQVRIAEDGEILVKGPSIFKGYWNKPEETAAALEDGWFHTGDIGHLDQDGFLFITDRKKDLIKTSGGKFIAPQPIELTLKSNPLIAEAAVIGDRRKYSVVVIAPQFAELEKWAGEQGISMTSREDLVSDDRVHALYMGAINEVNKNLAQFERIKKALIVPEEFTIANGLLTPTMKVKRRAVESKYRQQIEAMFSATESVGTRS